MDFNFTDEQAMLRDSVARYFGDHYAFPQRQAVIRSREGWRPGFWRGLADDVGILGAPFDDAMGGLGGGAIETMIVMEEIGKAPTDWRSIILWSILLLGAGAVILMVLKLLSQPPAK